MMVDGEYGDWCQEAGNSDPLSAVNNSSSVYRAKRHGKMKQLPKFQESHQREMAGNVHFAFFVLTVIEKCLKKVSP